MRDFFGRIPYADNEIAAVFMCCPVSYSYAYTTTFKRSEQPQTHGGKIVTETIISQGNREGYEAWLSSLLAGEHLFALVVYEQLIVSVTGIYSHNQDEAYKVPARACAVVAPAAPERQRCILVLDEVQQ